MRTFASGCLCVVMTLALGCTNAERNESIELMNEGLRLAQQQSYATAADKLRKAANRYRENHAAWYNLGQVLLQQKKWKEAADALSEAVKYNGRDAMYHYRLGQALYESWDDGSGGSLELAQTALEKAVELNPRLFKAHWYLGRTYHKKDKPAQAAAAWTESAKLDPGFGKPFVDLGKLYLQWDFVPQAIAVLEQGSLGHVLDGEDASNIYYHLGLCYDAQQNWAKAVTAYTNALDKRKDNVLAKLQRGFSYVKLGEKAKARADLEDYVKAKGGVPGEVPGLEVQVANDALMRLTAM